MKTVIEMAKEAGALPSREPFLNHFLIDKATLERFAALVREDEREACAKVCEERYDNGLMMVQESPWCAAAIRARGAK